MSCNFISLICLNDVDVTDSPTDKVHVIVAINRFCITRPIISTILTTKELPIKTLAWHPIILLSIQGIEITHNTRVLIAESEQEFEALAVRGAASANVTLAD